MWAVLDNKFSSTKMHKNFILNIHHDNHNDYIISLIMNYETII